MKRLLWLILMCAIPLPCIATDSEKSLEGSWILESDAGPKASQVLSFAHKGTTWTGMMTGRFGPIALTDIVYEGGHVAFGETFEGALSRFPPVRVEGVVAGDKLLLKVDGFRYGFIDRTAHRAGSADADALSASRTSVSLQTLPENGLARLPPMGWNSWNHFGKNIDEKTVREVADALAKSGLRDAGYVYVNLDDGWQGERSSKGRLTANANFPDMRKLADYLHERGLKLGIYSSPGPRTCAGFAGSYGHEEEDARTFAEWGVDYLKYDWCSARYVYSTPGEMQAAYLKMGAALHASGRPIVYSLCQYGMFDVGRWGRQVGGNLWRMTWDILDFWSRMEGIGFSQNGRETDAGPGGWNDPDMLEVGNGGMSKDEYQTNMTLWAILAAPLLLGNDVRSMTPETRALLTNSEVIAIDQDSLGVQGHQSQVLFGHTEIWTKALSDGSVAVAVFNRDDTFAEIQLKWADLRQAPIRGIRDLWRQVDLPTTSDSYSALLPPHGTLFLRMN